MRPEAEEENRERRGLQSGARLAAGTVPAQLWGLCMGEKGAAKKQQREARRVRGRHREEARNKGWGEEREEKNRSHLWYDG